MTARLLLGRLRLSPIGGVIRRRPADGDTPDEDGDRETDALLQYTWTLGMALTDRWGSFFELFGDIPLDSSGGAAHSADVGLTYLLRENLQLDAAVGVGLSSEADDWFITAGVSYLFRRNGR